MKQGDHTAHNQIIAILVFLKQMQAIVSKCPLDNDNDTDNDNDYEKGVWGKNAREETYPHSHWARDRKIQVLSLFLRILTTLQTSPRF